MDRYLEEISKTSADSDALELAASASTSMSPNRFTDKLYESMKWSLSVQPSSVASAGQVIPLIFDLFVLGSFSQRSSPSRHSPCILLHSFLCRPSFPAPFICGSTSSMSDWMHRFTPSRSISCRWRAWSRTRSTGTTMESSSTAQVSVSKMRRVFFRTFHADRLGASDQPSLGPGEAWFEAQCDGGAVRVLADAGTEVRSADPESLRCPWEVHV